MALRRVYGAFFGAYPPPLACDRGGCRNQPFSSGLIFLSNPSNASRPARLAIEEPGRGSLDLEYVRGELAVGMEPLEQVLDEVRSLDRRLRRNLAKTAGAGEIAQLFKSDLILLSNSSNEVSPLIFSPLMKKVGVASTLSCS